MGRTDREVKRREIAYDPLPSQKAFHECAARFKGFSGPVGSGKSQALCQEAIRLAYQNPGRMGLLGAPTFPMLRDATQATLFEILHDNEIPFEFNKAENMLVMLEGKTKILFRSMDEFERLRGTNLAWFGLDELTYTMEEAWLRLEGRLRDPKAQQLCGFAAWTPKGFDWVYRRFVGPTKTQGYIAVFAPPNENKYLLDQVKDYYLRLKDSYDEKFYAQEVLGEYVSLDGNRVYSSFDRGTHIVDSAADPNLPLMWSLDFNVDPMSSVVAQISRGMVRVLDEIVIRHGTTSQAAEEFLKRYPRHGGGLLICGDASGNAQQTTGNSDYDILKEYINAYSDYKVRYQVPKANPPVRDRVNLTNGKLRSASGKIALYVDPKCKELVQDFEQVCYKAEGGQIDKDRDRMRTHLSDALGYLLWQECRPVPHIGERSQRLV
ncbi:MAG TPA: phage terminase large subunit [Bryobacteraceae bacterium]|nr:phage terminase large subunit [Bryobacteraceae bacterium]